MNIALTLLGEPRPHAKHIEADVTIEGEHGDRTVRALIDSGASVNFISQLVVAEMKLKPSAVPAPAVRTLNGERLTTYYYHTLPLRMLDAGGKQLKTADYFLAADIEGFDMVLGMPWLRNIDPDIQWTEGTWAQRKWAAWKPRRRPRLVSA